MNLDKDYYTLLGVIPSAEDAVIRAAYKALAQRYHPDRYQGGQQEAHRLMSEINEAYAVISDEAKRREYDQLRAGRTGDIDQDETGTDPNVDAGGDPLDEGWALACEYYPELIPIGERLSQISWRLAYGYKAFMIEIKGFEQSEKFAIAFEKKFLEYHFGTNEEFLEFARKLIFSNNKPATKALNRALTVLGSGADPKRVIRKISLDFDIDGAKSQADAQRKEEELERNEVERARTGQKIFRSCPGCRALNDGAATSCIRCGVMLGG